MTTRRLPPLPAVRAFEAAARHRSMTRAAEELGVTPGAVSRQVRDLEARMEAPLFLRRATGLEPTEAGAALAAELGEALDRIAEAARGVRLRRPRRLSLGVYGFFASRFLMPRWTAMRAAFPDLAMDLHTSSNPLELTPGRFDAAIVVSDGAPRSGLVTRRLLPIETLPVCAPALLTALMADGAPDFATLPLLHARPRPDDWRRWLDHAGLRHVPADGGSSFESAGLAIEAAATGLGVAIGIAALLGPEIARGALVAAHPARRPTKRWFVLQHARRAAEEPALAAFADWLAAEAAAQVAAGASA
ncbi:transcriptional regulator, LysR family [Albimonas donghaensis]|uniref:Transcriptional regulator, LysR family n=1 Tax=Albimonas donghaensis TaxID=356660 RepID=A0A1H2YCB2_9RHOB|nr:LysR substrate-binding domain-containing protein [Albimonas donghaensis]SDX02787.1 transcriptional regulator, LysR family [Albimonas donghaensis]